MRTLICKEWNQCVLSFLFFLSSLKFKTRIFDAAHGRDGQGSESAVQLLLFLSISIVVSLGEEEKELLIITYIIMQQTSLMTSSIYSS